MKNAVFWELLCVALVRTDVSEERIVSIIRVTRIGEIGTMLTVTSKTANDVLSLPILVILMEAIHSSEMSVLTRATWSNIPEEGSFNLFVHILQHVFSLQLCTPKVVGV
jgi:hypothetical protein